ncbi:MAG: NADH-quinone oxidoreductase subunit NuoF [Spirochaetales bacterium]|nr:NADH-quinone oxidoreductase subunit NuoF [Spirochaetales bacterium]
MSRVTEIVVGMGSCGIAAGAKGVYDSLLAAIAQGKMDIKVGETGCIGACHKEPIIEVRYDNGQKKLFGEVSEKKITDFIASECNEKVFNQENAFPEDYPYLSRQRKVVLSNSGIIDPESIVEYLDTGGYEALKRVLQSMTPAQVVEEIKTSGLRGRGGAGFPTGMKWSFIAASSSKRKYMVCNADEGDPGAFMDRSVLEGDPHSVIEGMIIAAYAIGAGEGYIYVRAEYPLAIKRLNKALSQAEERNFLGNRILGTGFSFFIHIKEGAGAFVCGEETAMMASIEGKRGMPRLRPPYPAEKGLWGYPTNINNVETLANVPRILNMGAKKFASIGTEKSKGTKVFSLAGKIKYGGMVEVPMGMTLREIIFDIGGGIQEDKQFKAVQLGGPSGGCIPEELLDTPVDYESINATGAIMGSGGMVVMDETTCMVDVARYFLSFIQSESCGKCTFCRIGTKRMMEILQRITQGKGKLEDLDELEDLARRVKVSSLCGLGQTAPNPVLTTLKYFRDEYLAHIERHECPAMQCKALVRYVIDPNECRGCTICARFCPTHAASGDAKKPHSIDQDLCIQCGLCYEGCRFHAVKIATGVPA